MAAISIGFTGSQKGMSKEQTATFKKSLKNLLDDTGIRRFTHGDCIGSDEQAHIIVKDLPEAIGIDIYPPTKDSKRAFVDGYLHKFPEQPYLQRNHSIVDASDMLIATPNSYKEVMRSGTWATVRYARKQHKKIIIIYPNGAIHLENIQRKV